MPAAEEEEAPATEESRDDKKKDGKVKEKHQNRSGGLLGFLVRGRGRDKKKIKKKRKVEREKEREEAVMAGGIAPAAVPADEDDDERDVSPHDRGRGVERQRGREAARKGQKTAGAELDGERGVE